MRVPRAKQITLKFAVSKFEKAIFPTWPDSSPDVI
jgi:hypothetical protein